MDSQRELNPETETDATARLAVVVIGLMILVNTPILDARAITVRNLYANEESQPVLR